MINYFIDDFLLLVLLIGFLMLYSSNLNVDISKNKILKILLLEVIAITISNALEYYFSTFENYNYGRLIFSFLSYSLRPIIIITFISLLTRNKNIKFFQSLAVLNVLIYSTCFFSDVAFSFDSNNKFLRGPLGYSNHVLCLIYLFLLLLLIVKKRNKQRRNKTIILLFIALTSTIAATIDFMFSSSLFDQTILVCVLFYYLFLYIEYNETDPLTNVFNRATFYNDIGKQKKNISAIVSIDMNGLKKINDELGHLEGDKALVSFADVLINNMGNKIKPYRIGGDEFAIICFGVSETEVKKIISKIKNYMEKTKYSCSIGYAMCNDSNDIHDVYRKADKQMYKEKEKYYLKHNLERRRSQIVK